MVNLYVKVAVIFKLKKYTNKYVHLFGERRKIFIMIYGTVANEKGRFDLKSYNKANTHAHSVYIHLFVSSH